jgi:hypothetical protein
MRLENRIACVFLRVMKMKVKELWGILLFKHLPAVLDIGVAHGDVRGRRLPRFDCNR